MVVGHSICIKMIGTHLFEVFLKGLPFPTTTLNTLKIIHTCSKDVRLHLETISCVFNVAFVNYTLYILCFEMINFNHKFASNLKVYLIPVAYPGGCIACACTPGGLRGAPKRRGEKERSKERERKKRKGKGRQRRREGNGKKICKRKGKEGRNQKKIGYKKKNTRMATCEWQ